MRRRIPAALAIATTLVVVGAVSAYAHVSVQPGSAPKGSFSQLSFRVPNERETDTVKLEVQIPTDHPIANVSVKPMAGWTITTETTTLDEPIEVHGREVTEVVSLVSWEGGKLTAGQYDDFSISAGPLPEDTDQLVFKAIQTYSDGEEVAWIEEQTGDEEPERPAPVLQLTDPDGDGHGGSDATDTSDGGDEASSGMTVSAVSQDDVDSADTKAIIGIAIGLVGVIVGGLALLATRRRPTN